MEFNPDELKNLCLESVKEEENKTVWKAEIIKKNQ